jgi:hypothetical protein
MHVSILDCSALPFPNRARPIACGGARGGELSERALQTVTHIVMIAGVFTSIG